MALLDLDSFDGYATANLTEMWTSTSALTTAITVDSGSGRRSGNSLKFAIQSFSDARGAVYKTLAPSGAGIVLGFAFKVSAAPGSNGIGLVTILDGSTAQWSLCLTSDLKLTLRRGDQTGTILQTSGITGISTGVYAHVQVKLTLGTGTSGSFDVRVNNSSVFAGGVSSVNTAGAGTTTWSQVALGNHAGLGTSSNAIVLNIDDWVICDQSGSAFNTWLGDLRVDVRPVTGAGSSAQFAPSTGSNYQNVDDAAPNGDTDYNASTNAGDIDLFTIADAPVVGAGVLAFKVSTYRKKSDAGTCTDAVVVRHAGTNYVGTTQSPSTSYSYGQNLYTANPAGGALTESDFNAFEIGYKKVS